MRLKLKQLRILSLAICFFTSGQVAAASDSRESLAKAKNLRPQHALILNPYSADLEILIQDNAGTANQLSLQPNSLNEFLCIKCTISITTQRQDGSLVEIKQNLEDGRRYRLVRTKGRYELREIVAK